MNGQASPSKDKSEDGSNLSYEVQKRTKLEAQLTAGCGYGRKKQKLVHNFWTIIWAKLKEIGWRKEEGKGKDEGMIMFFPPGMAESKNGRRRKKYYDKIKDVIDRVLEKQSEEESKIAEAFLAKNQDYIRKENKASQSRPRRAAVDSSTTTSRRPSVLNHTKLDLSWKDGGSIYPKRSSRVGEEFQATEIPEIEHRKGGNVVESPLYCELIWDPKIGKESGVAAFIDRDIPSNKKEACLPLFHEDAYSLAGAKEKVALAKPIDGSDWTDAEKRKFCREIFRLRKDMKAVSHAMKKDMKSCLSYYLGTYKKSDHYRLLKTVLVDERNEKASSSVHGIDACAVCGDGGSLLICDGCEGEYHMSCVRPPLKMVPEGHWECDECVDRKFLEGRENIILTTSMYESTTGSRKRKADSLDDSFASANFDEKTEDIIMRPSSPVSNAVRMFATNLSKTLSA